MLNSKLALLLPQGFDFGAAHLPVLNLLAQFIVAGHAIAGDLVDPKVLVQIFEVVLLQPTVEHQSHDQRRVGLLIIGQNGNLDDAALRIGRLHHDLP